MSTDYTLLTWIARNHDPVHAPRSGSSEDTEVMGPTLTLASHERSPYRGRIRRVVILAQNDRKSSDAADRTAAELRELPRVDEVSIKRVELESPTDHSAIRSVVQPVYERLLRSPGTERLVINISPGTPAMHAVWLLITQTDPAFASSCELVETIEERHVESKEPVTRKIDLALRTEFKLHASRVRSAASPEAPPIITPGDLKSQRLRSFYEEAARVANLRVPVLIRGERGTGKTTVASFIRSKTPRSTTTRGDTAWQVACGSFAEELLASELFGYVKGAFTGAAKDTPGLLETVGDGALFFDEVGDLSRPMQRTLIKLVEEGEFRPVGSREAKKTSARFVFATNIDDAELNERIDTDFLDRVGYIRLHVPPLRECVEDVPTLWRGVARAAGARAEFPLEERLDDSAHNAICERLASTPLDGNFRDLYRIAYRLCVELQRDTTVADAIDAAFEGPPSEGRVPGDVAPFEAAVAAWLRREPLHETLRVHGSIPIKHGSTQMKGWLASELRVAATALGRKHGDVSDLPQRTLYAWANGKSK